MSTLAELFAKDPEHLTKEDLEQIIVGFRAARANFQTGNKSAAAKKNTTGPAIPLTDIEI